MGDHLGRIADVLLVVGPCMVWFYRWTRKLDTTVGLTRQVAKVHLPFIYERLQVHDEAIGVHSPLPPNIGLINGDGNGSH